MLRLPITYTDFNDNSVTEDFYFHMTKSELIEMEMQYENGFIATIQKIINSNDRKSLIAEFKKLIMLTYGVKSADGKRFIKSDELRREFADSAAYDALFMSLATDEGAGANFVMGIMPEDLRKSAAAELAEKKAEILPPPLPPAA